MPVIAPMLRAKFAVKNEELDKLDALVKRMFGEFQSLGGLQEIRTS
jgi:hypothetical protein